IAEAPRVLLAAADRGMGSLSGSTGVGIKDERSLEDRLQDVAQRVMDDPVAIRGRADQAGLGLADRERSGGARAIRLSRQLVVESPESAFQVVFEPEDVGAKPFPAPRLPGGSPQVRKRDDLRPEIADALHFRKIPSPDSGHGSGASSPRPADRSPRSYGWRTHSCSRAGSADPLPDP